MLIISSESILPPCSTEHASLSKELLLKPIEYRDSCHERHFTSFPVFWPVFWYAGISQARNTVVVVVIWRSWALSQIKSKDCSVEFMFILSLDSSTISSSSIVEFCCEYCCHLFIGRKQILFNDVIIIKKLLVVVVVIYWLSYRVTRLLFYILIIF